MKFTIVDWNINSINVRIEQLLSLIKKYNPDIICLQEIKSIEQNFPHKLLIDQGYKIYLKGQKGFNGVAILSKTSAEYVSTDFIGNILPHESRFIEISTRTAIGMIRVISLYVPNGQEVSLSHKKFTDKISFLEFFFKYCSSMNNLNEKTIIAGDFNIAPFGIDHFLSIEESRGKICLSLEERLVLRKFLNSGWKDHFRILNPQLQEFSWWDYRQGCFKKNLGYRIDFIFSNERAVENLTESIIDKDFRGLARPSDHVPVISIWSN